MTSWRRHTTAVLAAAAVAVAGCGGDEPKIPQDNADALVRVLRAVKRQTDARACTAVNRTIASLERRVELLPSKTDKDIRGTLNDGIANLRELVAGECSETKPKPKKQDTSTETETSTPPTTSEPTTTETQTTETETETTPPDTSPPPTEPPPATNPSGGTPPGQQKKQGKKK